MSRTRLVFLGSLACLVVLAGPAAAQASAASPAAASTPHTIVINLVERPGPMAFAFEPATFSARHGDTLRFVQAASAMHNVHFKTQAKGAHLGAAAMSQYLTSKGQAYTLVVDSRFTDGTYEIVCDPHETIGMHAFLTVTGAATAVAAGKP
ncbi:MAG TPA: plastocyanin/azurin family copper-binding protein [Gemmatimonadaceae bacterium]|nr:plastocyanin/azurin family copper-binding protein [Gemmatimonadaceae bacterium]